MDNRFDEIRSIARVVHQVNKAYCESLGDFTQKDWVDTPEEIKNSAIDGVKFHFANPDVTPEQSHENWLKFKKEQGWTWGPVKDLEKKEHPCFTEYSNLPQEQKSKDYIFKACVANLRLTD